MQTVIPVKKTAWIYKIEGRFGTGKIPSIEDVMPHDKSKKYQVLALDMTTTEYVDSSALSFLILLLNHSRKSGMEMVLVGVPDPIIEIIRISNLDKFFTILPMNKFERLYPD